MPETAKEMLDELDRFFLNASYGEAGRLWDVLAALRGPDDPVLSSSIKAKTTAVIRAAAFPRSGFMIQVNHANVARGKVNKEAIRDVLYCVTTGQGHFFAHLRSACYVFLKMAGEAETEKGEG